MRMMIFPVIATLCLSVGAAISQDSGPAAAPKDFTFRRIAAPPSGQKPKIDVQVDPAAYAAWMSGKDAPDVPTGGAAALPAAASLAPNGWEWFWANVSAQAAEGGPANLATALDALEAEGTPGPRLQTLQDIASRHGRTILAATVGTDVSPALVVALISVESGGNPGAESAKGAQGLMQLIPDTASRFGVEDPTDPEQSINGGVAYLAWLMKEFDRDPILALAGYNAGENAVKDNNGVPPFAETRAYVPKVLNAWRVARGLCLTPPQLITDGCVFAVQG